MLDTAGLAGYMLVPCVQGVVQVLYDSVEGMGSPHRMYAHIAGAR